MHRWLDTVLDGPVAGQLTELVGQLNPHAASDALGQKLLALTVPGIPDVYQGTELWDDSLVDPDNRRAVDYAARRAALKELQHPKIRVVTTALRLRRSRPDCFLHGDYVPVLAAGQASDHVVAFRRGADILVAVTRWTVRLAETGWGNTVLPLTRWLVDRPAHRSHVERTDLGRPIVRRSARRAAGARSVAEFRVWAPKPERVRLDVDGAVHDMTRSDDGWWHASVDTPPDARYGFLLDDDPTVLPDPRSPRQPDGVHDRSQLWDARRPPGPTATGLAGPVAGAVIYELHVGTFTAAGTFDAAIEKLDYLVDLGIDFVELMPVNSFAGTHGWGYDGVLWYSVHEPYGGPDGLVRFVDACHARGLGVLIDAVFNHLGPSGNYLPQVRAVPVFGEQPVGRGHQHRRRRLRRGAPLHHRVRIALDARLPRRRPAAGRCARARGHHRHAHPGGTRHRNRLAVTGNWAARWR